MVLEQKNIWKSQSLRKKVDHRGDMAQAGEDMFLLPQQNISLSQKHIAPWSTPPQRIPAFLWCESNCIILHEHSVQYLFIFYGIVEDKAHKIHPANKICMSQIWASNFSLWITCVFSMTLYWQNLQFLCFFQRENVFSQSIFTGLKSHSFRVRAIWSRDPVSLIQ